MANIVEITDISAPELEIYFHLTEAQLRSRREIEKGLFIAESPKVITYALEAGYEPVSMLMEKKHLSGQGRPLLEHCGEIPVYTGESELLEKLTGFRLTRGILAAFRRKPLPGLEAVCREARRIVVLEGITDATNVGAIIRSAAALNMDAVLVNPTCCDPLNRRSVRVSMGTVFQIPWTRIGESSHTWPEDGLCALRELGFKTVAMALTDRSVSVDDPNLMEEEKLAIILGTEGDGLLPKTVEDCDYTVKIPMGHGVDSLNVAAAGAVAFWQLGIR